MPKASIFDKLTDSSQYTGAHKHRFDSSGKGLEGRDSIAKGHGRHPNNLGYRTESSTTSGPMGSPSFKPTKPKVKKGSIFDKLTDSSQYTGAHKHRFDDDGKGKGLEGRDSIAKGHGRHPDNLGYRTEATGTTKTKTTKTKKSSKMGQSDFKPTKTKTKGTIFDKLTDHSLYTGAHKSRFDSGGRGLGGDRIAKGQGSKSLDTIGLRQ